METNDLDTVVVRVQNLCIDLETQEVEAVIFLCDLKNHNVVPTFYGTTQASQFARGSITQKAFLTEFLRFCEEIHSRRKRNELISASQAEPEEDMMTLDMSVEEATNEDDKNWQQEQIASDPFQVADKQPQAQQIGGKNLWEQNFNQFVRMMDNDTEKKDDNSGKKSEKLDTNYKKNLTDSEKTSVSSHNVTVKREVTFEDSEQYGKLPGYSEDVSVDQNLVTEIKTEPIDPDDVSLINNEYTASHNTVTGKTNIGNRLSSSSVSVSMAANQQGVERGKSSGVTSRYAVSTSGNVRTTCGSTVLPVGTISSTVEGATNSQSVLLLVPVHATIPTQKSAVPPNSLSSIPTSSVPSIPAQISLIPMNRAPVPSPQVSLLNESASPLNAQSQKAVVESSPQSLLKRSNVTTSNDCVEPLFKQQKVTQTLQKPVSFTHTTGATEKNRRMKNIKCVAVQKPGSDESISVTQKQGSIASGSKTDVSKAAVPSEPGRGILRASKRIHDKKITYSATTAKESAKGSNSTPQKQNAKQMSRKDHQTVSNDKASTSEADDADVEEDEDDSADDEKLGIPTEESTNPSVDPMPVDTRPTDFIRFASVTDEDLKKYEAAYQSTSTKLNTNWSKKLFQDWHIQQFGSPLELAVVSADELNRKLRRFYCEAKTKSGKHYHKNTLKNMRAALNRHLSDLGREIDIVRDKKFKQANKILDGVLKHMVQSGVSRPTKHKTVITRHDLQKIATYFQSAESNPVVLRQAVWYHLSIHFVSCGLEFHHQIQMSSLKFDTDDSGDEYVTLSNECQQRKFKGGLYSHEAPSDKRIYATGQLNCPIRLLRLLIKRTDDSATFLFNKCFQDALFKPVNHTIWFANKPLSRRSFNNIMPDIANSSGCTERYTAHCLRATAINTMSKAGYEARQIMFMSGHRSENSIHNYNCNLSVEQKKKVSATLSNICSSQVATPDIHPSGQSAPPSLSRPGSVDSALDS